MDSYFDGDDAFLPDRLSRLLARAKTTQTDIVVDNLLVHHEADGSKFPMFNPEWLSKLDTLDLATFISENRMFQRGYTLGYLKPLFLTDFIRKHHLTYDTELRIGEDYLLLAEALAQGATCIVEGVPGYQYSVRAGSTSHRLTPEDVARIIEGDKKFLSRTKLDDKSAKAQKRRSKSLHEAYAYTKLVDAIKQRNVRDIFGILTSCPKAALPLWEPVWCELKGCADDIPN